MRRSINLSVKNNYLDTRDKTELTRQVFERRIRCNNIRELLPKPSKFRVLAFDDPAEIINDMYINSILNDWETEV